MQRERSQEQHKREVMNTHVEAIKSIQLDMVHTFPVCNLTDNFQLGILKPLPTNCITTCVKKNLILRTLFLKNPIILQHINVKLGQIGMVSGHCP